MFLVLPRYGPVAVMGLPGYLFIPSFIDSPWFCLLQIRSHVAQASLDLSMKQRLASELLILLPLPSEYRDIGIHYHTCFP